MLLPHGHEGQGPEHSSARLERYLQMSDDTPFCDDDFKPENEAKMEYITNMQICNVTMPANYFHLLRRQMKRAFRKPLIVMSPKSGLRHKLAKNDIEDFCEGSEF